MTRFGYTLMTEQSGPKDLVRWAVAAEQAGFDFEVSSDHYSPWLTEQGHAPYAWSVLGAVAHATERVDLMTYVTCPTIRYHPAVVAQKAATLQILADGRFTLGVGSGESLNEHVVGEGWPGVITRQEMLVEAIDIIRQLHTGDLVTHHGDYFDVDSARIWDVPDEPVQIGVAVGGDKGIDRLAPLADHLIAVEPDADLITSWNDTAGRAAHRWLGTGDRADPDLLGPRPRRGGRARPPAVPLVRRRLVGQLRPADARRLLRGEPVRASRGRRRVDPVRPGPRRHRRGRQRLLEGRLHRHRPRPGGRGHPGGLPRAGCRAAARQAAEGGLVSGEPVAAPDVDEARRLLRTYLRDHDSGALAGARRFGSAAQGHRDPQARAELTALHAEVEQDRRSLASVMRRLEVTPDPLKRLVTAAGEQLGRLKPNGFLAQRSPLTDVVEIEALTMAVTGKQRLWETLAALGPEITLIRPRRAGQAP